MRYCADTWFILSLFNEVEQSVRILRETKEGKSHIIIPMVVFAESTKKLLQRGVSQATIDLFWEGVEASEKVQLLMLDRSIAQEAAKISLSFNVPMIDSFVAATCKLTGCHSLFAADSDYIPLVKRKYLKIQSW